MVKMQVESRAWIEDIAWTEGQKLKDRDGLVASLNPARKLEIRGEGVNNRAELG